MESAHKKNSANNAPAASITTDFISNALVSAYIELNFDICSGPLRLLSDVKAGTTPKAADVNSLVAPATSNACALTVLVDDDRQEVYVANTGDARAGQRVTKWGAEPDSQTGFAKNIREKTTGSVTTPIGYWET
ncbi:hypothetical protein QFC21_002533 [Naganishia friedmannii]|uniref:Uncharacterized protein n=1 Tax=Naganishia friedmannii TaxID=89922 RepID=A0ACC2VWE7_9TREE|nr:hypothetical protein QFC21_002533 [Naganishia friedmannii]